MHSRKTIIEAVAEQGIELRSIGNLLRGFCPFHDDKGKPNFTVYAETDSWFCFACGEGGDVIQFLAKLEGVPYHIIKDRLEGDAIDLSDLQEKIDGAMVEDTPETYNFQANILISKLIREFLQKYPDKSVSILEFLKKFDLKLFTPVMYKDFQKIVEETRQTLSDLVK